MSLANAAPTSADALLEARGIVRQGAAMAENLLNPTDFRLPDGERVAVTGSSGSGKSVFFRMLALLDPPDSDDRADPGGSGIDRSGALPDRHHVSDCCVVCPGNRHRRVANLSAAFLSRTPFSGLPVNAAASLIIQR